MRLAHVIPLTRLPKTVGVFSYVVPDEIECEIVPGQLVSIPFRKREILGLVKKTDIQTNTHTDLNLKNLVRLENEVPLVSELHINCWSELAEIYGVAPSVIAMMGLLPLKKTKIRGLALIPLPPLAAVKKNSVAPEAIWYHTPAARLQFILEKISRGRTAVILPERHQVYELLAELPPEVQANTIIWESQQTDKEQFVTWQRLRNREFTLLIGTRGTVLLPLAGFVDTAILDYEHDQNVKHWDQMPRFHARDVLTYLADHTGLTTFFSSSTPSCSAYQLLKNPLVETAAAEPSTKKSPTIVTLTFDPRHFVPLASGIMEKISGLAELPNPPDLAFLLNRRGAATALICRDCGRTEICPQCELALTYSAETRALTCHYCNKKYPLPLVCAACQSPLLQLRGSGTELVETHLKTALSGTAYRVIRLEGEETALPPDLGDAPRCVIGTDAALPHIRFGQTELAALLDTDAGLARAEYMATEMMWHRIWDMQFRLPTEASLYVQTRRPDHWLYQSLARPAHFYETELETRTRLGYPPAAGLVRYLCTDPSKTRAHTQAGLLQNTLKTVLTRWDKKSIVQGPIELTPGFFRGVYWYAVVVRVPPIDWLAIVRALNEFIPAGVKVDPNPITILSPT